jgi:hypothetical protein
MASDHFVDLSRNTWPNGLGAFGWI